MYLFYYAVRFKFFFLRGMKHLEGNFSSRTNLKSCSALRFHPTPVVNFVKFSRVSPKDLI